MPAQERRGGDGVGEKPSPSVSRPPEDSGGAEAGEGAPAPSEAVSAASSLLSSLEGPLSLGKRQVAELAPFLAEVAATEKWPVGAELKAHLTKTRNGSPVKDAKRVLRYRIENLPPYQGRSTARVEAGPQPGEEMCKMHPARLAATCPCDFKSVDVSEASESSAEVREQALAEYREMMSRLDKERETSVQERGRKTHSGRT